MDPQWLDFWVTTYLMIVQFEKSLPEEPQLRLVESVQKNTYRYLDVCAQAVDAVMPKETKEVTYVKMAITKGLWGVV